MEQPLISVIVPVYRAERYLSRCVQSIRNQTYRNLEIILVDDGSPDNCGEMCDQYAREDSRIRVFHKENGGQSSARNLGLDNMTGEFVGFVDSDDWIEPDMYRRLYDLITAYDAQIAACGLQRRFPDGRVMYFNSLYPAMTDIQVFTTLEALQEVTYAEKITNSPCDKLFHRSTLAGVRMREGTVYEDFEMMPYCLERAERVVYDPAPLYHYRMTDSSTTRGAFKESRFLEAEISRERIRYYQKKYPQLVDYALAAHAEICLLLIITSIGIPEFAGQRSALIREQKAVITAKAFRVMKRNNKIKFLLFRLNADLFSRLMLPRCGG